MSKTITVQSHKGPYSVLFNEDIFSELEPTAKDAATHVIIDKAIATLYKTQLASILEKPSTLIIEATEENKSLDKFPAYIEHLVYHKVRKNHTLLAIGGGILQDIACFIAATLLRGITWDFIPTTLLAQADSCIGSKSSINVGKTKNILGTFTPPRRITISSIFLNSLDKREIHSGIGEMLKVHGIDGKMSFDTIAGDFEKLFFDRATLLHYIHRSLEIKRKIIEQDEFDTNIRNVMNYGHSIGHAIESATNFKVPHGIAVTLGIDVENFISSRINHGNQSDFERSHQVLQQNAPQEYRSPLDMEALFSALSRDKKNTDSQISLILLDKNAQVQRVRLELNQQFKNICNEYFSTYY